MVKLLQSTARLKEYLLHGKGREVDKNDPILLAALDDYLYAIIQEFNLENIYNMDETGLFFWTLPQYGILMLQEDLINMAKGTKKVKEWVTLVVCMA